MMKHFAIVVLWCLLNTSVAHGCENLSRADETVRALRQTLRISNIGQVHVFFVPYDRLPVIAVSPSALERSWEIQINPAESLEYLHSLDITLGRTKLCALGDEPDLHWGIVIYDKGGARITSIYLDKKYFLTSKIRGKINGINVLVDKYFLDWFEDNFLKNVLHIKPHVTDHGP